MTLRLKSKIAVRLIKAQFSQANYQSETAEIGNFIVLGFVTYDTLQKR